MLSSSTAGKIFSLSEELIVGNNRCTPSEELLLTPKEIEKKLNAIEDQLIDDPRNLIYDSLYFELKNLLSFFNELNIGSKFKLIGLIQSSFSKLLQNLKSSLISSSKNGGFESNNWKSACEMYSVLLYQTVCAAENQLDKQRPGSAKGKSNVPSIPNFDWSHIRIGLLESLKLFSTFSLGRIFDSSADRESIVTCIIKSAHKILENPENVAKSLNTRKAVLEVLTECAKSQGCVEGLKTFILQDLIYSEHLSEPIAELFKFLYETGDSKCFELCEKILKSIGSQRFNSQESATSTKSAAIFFTKFASIASKEALNTLSLFIDQLDSEAYVIRMAMVEVIGVLIYYLMRVEDRSDTVKAQTKSLFAALEERFHDVNSFVRSKTLQVCCDLAKSSSIPITKRPKLLELAAERVMDKSSNVRRKAIQLIGDLLKTHSFGVDGGELNLTFFKSRLNDIERLLNEIVPSKVEDIDADGIVIEIEQEATERFNRMSMVDNSARIGSLLAQKQYYSDAIKFVIAINNIIPSICLLLSSTTKTEVFDVMEFLVDAHIYKLESSSAGIRKMLHLIWEKELSSEDGTKQSIKEHLIENYRKIYLYADDAIPPKDRHILIARNLVTMLDGISIAELASLTELFSCFVKKNLISEPIIQQIFTLFASSEIDKRARRSALIIISILAKTKRDVVEKRLETLLKMGLGTLGQSDPLIAQYTLITLQSLSTRIPSENVLFTRIYNFIASVCNSSRWHSVINQGINTIFLLADRPSLIMTRMLIEQSREVFQNGKTIHASQAQLGKLLLMIGQVSACLSDHLDTIERHGKETAQKLDASTGKGNDSDLAKVSGSAEDDFSELVKGVREHEVLFGPNSILSVLGAVVIEVCSNNTVFNDVKIQRIATLALSKLMTISSIFCERNLQLFLTILEKSKDSVIRSNLIIAFGDLAQVFNRLVDQNIDYLFDRLRDEDLRVRRNTLMVLTHLTLCGMIKVKGQIGEIAKCLIDPDLRIRNLARIFFSEMADRDSGTIGGSGIYNHIPDILSNLTDQIEIEPDDFKLIMKFIFEFIKKEKQMENLIEKLCGRFRNSDTLRHSRDLAYCLSLISFSGERSLKKLLESFPLYQDKLVDETVLGYFIEIGQRGKKFCKPEMKHLIDEFEVKILQAAKRDGSSQTQNLTSFSSLTAKKVAQKKLSMKGSISKQKKKKQGKHFEVVSDEEEEEDFESDDEKEKQEDHLESIKMKSRRPSRHVSSASATAKGKMKNLIISDDDNDNCSDNEDIF